MTEYNFINNDGVVFNLESIGIIENIRTIIQLKEAISDEIALDMQINKYKVYQDIIINPEGSTIEDRYSAEEREIFEIHQIWDIEESFDVDSVIFNDKTYKDFNSTKFKTLDEMAEFFGIEFESLIPISEEDDNLVYVLPSMEPFRISAFRKNYRIIIRSLSTPKGDLFSKITKEKTT